MMIPHWIIFKYTNLFQGQRYLSFYCYSALYQVGAPTCTCSLTGAHSSVLPCHSGSVSRWRDPLYMSCCALLHLRLLDPAPTRVTLQWPCNSTGEPRQRAYPLSKCRRNISSSAHQLFWSWTVPSLSRGLSMFPILPYVISLSCLLHTSCSIGSQLSLKRNFSECLSSVNEQVLARTWRRENPCMFLVGIQIGAASVESSTEIPQQIKKWVCLLTQ